MQNFNWIPPQLPRSPADQDAAAADSAVRVLIVRAQEDWAIAHECWKLARTTHEA
jgi:acetate kinase